MEKTTKFETLSSSEVRDIEGGVVSVPVLPTQLVVKAAVWIVQNSILAV